MVPEQQMDAVREAVEPEREGGAAVGFLSVEIVSTTQGFDALEAGWNALLEQSDARIFQTYEWQRAWWRHYGESRQSIQLHLLLIREEGELIGIAPLCIETVVVVWPLTYRLMTFAGRGPSDYLDLIARRGREAVVASVVATHLGENRRQFDVLLLEEIRETSPSGAPFYEALRSQGLTGERFIGEQCPRLQMGETFDETTQLFSRNKRTRMLKNVRTVMKDFAAEYEVIGNPADVDTAMNEFIQIHQARWNDVGHQGVFADPVANGFHRDVARALFLRGWLLLAFLRVRGERKAADYGIVYRGEFMTYLGGVRGEEEFLRLSPGRALLVEIMQRSIPAGVRVFDFMRGTERYKYELGGTNVPNWTIMMFSRPGRSGPLLHRGALLRVALQRRMIHEGVHLAHHARKHGIISRGFAGYAVRRVGTVIVDGLQKLRAPEKTIVMGKAEE
jgi:CelD/BcsL family acetyltransferase involved in cellulose biosynthesis